MRGGHHDSYHALFCYEYPHFVGDLERGVNVDFGAVSEEPLQNIPVVSEGISEAVSLSFSSKSSTINWKKLVIKMPKHWIAIRVCL